MFRLALALLSSVIVSSPAFAAMTIQCKNISLEIPDHGEPIFSGDLGLQYRILSIEKARPVADSVSVTVDVGTSVQVIHEFAKLSECATGKTKLNFSRKRIAHAPEKFGANDCVCKQH